MFDQLRPGDTGVCGSRKREMCILTATLRRYGQVIKRTKYKQVVVSRLECVGRLRFQFVEVADSAVFCNEAEELQERSVSSYAPWLRRGLGRRTHVDALRAQVFGGGHGRKSEWHAFIIVRAENGWRVGTMCDRLKKREAISPTFCG